MSDIVAFLRARLDEEEAEIRETLDDTGDLAQWEVRIDEPDEPSGDHPVWVGTVRGGATIATVGDVSYPSVMPLAHHIAAWDPARVLAEIAVKRALLDVLVEDDRIADASHEMRYFGRVEVAEDVALGFARIYATHPDFDATWRTS